MRTTVTLDADVVRLLRDEAHKRGASFKVALNDAVRSAFASKSGRAGRRKPFVGKPFKLGPPMVDLQHVNRLLDEMDADEYLSQTKRRHQNLKRGRK